MPSVGWVPLGLTGLLAAVTGYHLYHLSPFAGRGGHQRRIDVDLSHALMGGLMVWMLRRDLPGGAGPWLVAGLAGTTAWFVVAGVRRYVLDGPGEVGREAVQVAVFAAMTYLAALAAGLSLPSADVSGGLVPPTSSMPGMVMPAGGSAQRLLAGLLLAAVLLAAAWTVRTGARRTRADRPDRVATGCQLAMDAATVYMLLALL
jgi:hypothetical protein